jgi:hypothetical protein
METVIQFCNSRREGKDFLKKSKARKGFSGEKKTYPLVQQDELT